MQCPRCGAPSAPGASSCGRCGLGPSSTPSQATQPHEPWPGGPPPPWPPQPPGAPPRSRLVPVLLVLVTVLVLTAGTVAGVVLWPQSGSPAGPAQPAQPVGSPTAFPDFSAVYADVSTGVGQVSVQTCRGGFTGTGFLVGPDLVATAAHVVAHASALEVQLEAGTVPAEIFGVDLSHDLALLKLDQRVDGHVFAFAPSDPQPGTHIAAIGFPLGEPKTLTEGTVSGLDRSIRTDSGSFTGLLQTDTAINPGNSGGPLLDITGRVVGVADAIRTDAQGIGFAVPTTIASRLTSNPLQTQQLDSCP